MKNWCKGLGIISLLMMFMLLTTACNVMGKDNTEAELQKVLEDNAKAMNNKDLNSYMNSIAKEANPNGYEQTKITMEQIFEKYDLEATVKNFNVVSVSEDSAIAIVEVEQDTINKDTNSATFKNNRVIAEHTLVKESNQWKIKSTLLKSRKEIDRSGKVIGDL
jgi:ketosteroid isomerase-like protein